MFYTKEDVHGVISTRLGSSLSIVNWIGAHLCVQAPSVAKQLCVWYQIPILWRHTESLLLLLTCVFFEASAKRCWRMKPCEEPTIPVARHLEGSLPLDAGCWCKSKHLQQSCNHMQVDSDVEDLRWLESSGLVKVSFTQRLSRICSDPRLRVYNFSASHCWSRGFPPIYRRMETGTWKTGLQMQQMKQMPKSFLSIS